MNKLTEHDQLRIEFAKAALQGLSAIHGEETANSIAQSAWTIADEMMAVGKDIGFIPNDEPARLPCGCPDDGRHYCQTKE